MEVYLLADLEPISVSPRTRLYNLEPIAAETAQTESLTSYVARLAAAHRVAPATFVTHEFASHLVPKHPSDALSYVGGSFDGVSATAGRVIKLVETATGRQNLLPMTMRQWSNILSPLELLRQADAWCPKCFADWKANQQPAYTPLLWRVKVVTVCPIHHCALVESCPYCGRQLRLRDCVSTPGCCASCNHDLAQASPDFGNGDITRWDLFAARSVSEIIEKSSRLTESPHRCAFVENISILIDRIASGSVHRFTKLLRAGHDSTFRMWRNGSATPQLPRLLLVCYRLGISPVDLVCNKLQRDSDWLASINYDVQRQVIRRLQRHDLKELQHRLEQIACSTEFPPISLSAVSRKLGYNLSGLTRRFPQLAQAITQRYRSYVDLRKNKRRAHITENLKTVVAALCAAGERITPRKVRVRLENPGWLMEEWVRREYQRIRNEFGILEIDGKR